MANNSIERISSSFPRKYAKLSEYGSSWWLNADIIDRLTIINLITILNVSFVDSNYNNDRP